VIAPVQAQFAQGAKWLTHSLQRLESIDNIVIEIATELFKLRANIRHKWCLAARCVLGREAQLHFAALLLPPARHVQRLEPG
jgi:hypothetical protein